MKCFLHIGTEKTGSTTLQGFLNLNQEKLLQNGFYYPKSLGLPNNRLLSVMAYNSNRRDGFTRRKGIKTDEDLINFQNKIKAKFKREISTIENDTNLILSNEHIQSRLTSVEEIIRLKSILNELGIDDISIIIYLRNPSEIANSLFSTAIKSGGVLDKVPPPTDKYFGNVCNHKATIERFSEVFGEDKLKLRLFRKDRLVNQSLIEDFLEILGVETEVNEFKLVQNQNESLSELGIEILRNLNLELKNSENLKLSRLELVKLISRHFNEPKYVMPKEMYEEYENHFEQSNNWVREKFFPKEIELFNPKPKINTQDLIQNNEIKNISNFILEILKR